MAVGKPSTILHLFLSFRKNSPIQVPWPKSLSLLLLLSNHYQHFNYSLSLSLSLSLTLTPTNISKKPFPLIPLTCLLSLHLQDVKLYCRVQQGGNQRWSEAPHKAVQTQRRNQGQPGGCSCPPVLNFGWLSRPFERNSSWVGWQRLQSYHLWHERRWEVKWEGFSHWLCRNQGCYCYLQLGLSKSLFWQDFAGGLFCRYDSFPFRLVCSATNFHGSSYELSILG